MQQDFRNDPAYAQVEQVYRKLCEPGFGQVTDIGSLTVADRYDDCVIDGSIMSSLQGLPHHRLFLVSLDDGSLQPLTDGPHNDIRPVFAPDGERLVFLSDRKVKGIYQPHLLQRQDWLCSALPEVPGTIEALSWSPNGKQVLFVVAGLGADTAGKDGAMTTQIAATGLPSWMPSVETGDESHRWRTLWVLDVQAGQVRQVSRPGVNVWEASWCGDEHIGALISDDPGEAAWYSADLALVDVRDGSQKVVYVPALETDWPAGSPDGRYLAVAEGCTSDREVVAGELKLVDLHSGAVQTVDTHDVAVTDLSWRDAETLIYFGQREFEVVVGEYKPPTDQLTEHWCSESPGCGYWHPTGKAYGKNAFVTVTESFRSPPALTVIKNGTAEPVLKLEHEGTRWVDEILGEVTPLRWPAADGLEIQGWLLEPNKPRPHAVVMEIHGGPVWAWRNFWIGRVYSALFSVLLDAGYAVFLPNPRGSCYRGQDYALRVRGDMGGADTQDYLSGLDYLAEQGMIDPARIGVTGSSYGGFMSNWIITQDQRFAAAVPRHGIGNWVSFHYTANVPFFDEEFLGSDPLDTEGLHVTRSPIRYAANVVTPTLHITGALDRITPASQALEMHRALLESGVESVLVTYPEEGHSLRTTHGTMDVRARLLHWYQKHMPA